MILVVGSVGDADIAMVHYHGRFLVMSKTDNRETAQRAAGLGLSPAAVVSSRGYRSHGNRLTSLVFFHHAPTAAVSPALMSARPASTPA